ncbi:hypothetical protein V6B14_23090 (plasmid) [Sporosarcina psychrophila]|uniref:hypothetical protein n=1 Tax=Sporosarcina psychrophila TaxID=1476 RepID=UPI0030D188A5
MAIINIEVGQLVFIIEDNDIFEGNITSYLNKKEVMVTSKNLYYPITRKTYGVDFFITREKASKVLALNLEEVKKRELERQHSGLKLDQERGELYLKAKKSICNSCGFLIGNFGHCGCS